MLGLGRTVVGELLYYVNELFGGEQEVLVLVKGVKEISGLHSLLSQLGPERKQDVTDGSLASNCFCLWLHTNI